jgi:cell division protein FtsB
MLHMIEVQNDLQIIGNEIWFFGFRVASLESVPSTVRDNFIAFLEDADENLVKLRARVHNLERQVEDLTDE